MLTPKALLLPALFFTAGCSRGETASATSRPIEAPVEAAADTQPEPAAAAPEVMGEERGRASAPASAASVEVPRSAARVAQKPPRPQPRTVYVCPMHPDVVRDQPGDCPKCSMHLEPRPAAEVREAEARVRLSALETGEVR